MTGTSSTPLGDALSRVGDRWSLLIVEALMDRGLRWGDLQDTLGIAPNVLSDRLKRLEREGVITGAPYSRRPLRLVYDLTPAGRELAGALRLLSEWGARGAGGGGGLRHVACGTPLDARWYCPTCSRALDEAEADDLRFV